MHNKYYITFFFVAVLAGGLLAQEQKKLDYAIRKSQVSLIDQASAVKENSPTQAIKLLEKAVFAASKRKDFATEGRAYVLLGNIYEAIDQQELALQRYQQALSAFSRIKDVSRTASIYHRMGLLYLDFDNDQDAEKSFNACLEVAGDDRLRVKCVEGLADVELLRGNAEASNVQLDYVMDNYSPDSLTQARLDARRSQAYIQQNDYSKASDYYYNSINSIPKNSPIDEDDYAPIERAQTDLLNFNNVGNLEKIEVRNSLVALSNNPIPEDVLLRENLRIVSLYEEEDNLLEAEKFIKASKNVINPNTSAATAADIYKKSSELNQQKGDVEAALQDLGKYIEAKELAIQDLEDNLNEQIEIVKGQKGIDEMRQGLSLEEKEKALLQSQLQTQRIIIGFLTLMLLASLVYFYFLFKNVKAKRKANQLLLLKSLRTQMNPHFIFNALNSVNNFIAKNDEKAANKFLADFSRLMRKVLDYSQKDFISFEEEIELNELYLKLEHFRFRDKFDYVFDNAMSRSGYELEVPPMLIQPFIENAVWHGLRYKEVQGCLSVRVEEEKEGLVVTIQDDGIGRTKSKALKTVNQKKNKSTGLENVSKRIALINEIYQKNYKISVADVDGTLEDTGTLVRINIPFDDE